MSIAASETLRTREKTEAIKAHNTEAFSMAQLGSEYYRRIADNAEESPATRIASQVSIDKQVRGYRSEHSEKEWGLSTPVDLLLESGHDPALATEKHGLFTVERTTVLVPEGDGGVQRLRQLQQDQGQGGPAEAAHGVAKYVRIPTLEQIKLGNALLGSATIFWRESKASAPHAVEVAYIDPSGLAVKELIVQDATGGWQRQRKTLREIKGVMVEVGPTVEDVGGALMLDNELKRISSRVEEAAEIKSFGEWGKEEYNLLNDSRDDGASYSEFAERLRQHVESEKDSLLQTLARLEQQARGFDAEDTSGVTQRIADLKEQIIQEAQDIDVRIGRKARLRMQNGKLTFADYQADFKKRSDSRASKFLSTESNTLKAKFNFKVLEQVVAVKKLGKDLTAADNEEAIKKSRTALA